MELSRRKFFSFFGTGVAMLAKPDLFIPKQGIQTVTVEEFAWIESQWEPITMEQIKSGSFQLHAVWALAQ